MNNKDTVLAAMTDLFIRRDLGALNRYWDPNYVQHNPRMPNGLDFFKKVILNLPSTFKYEPGLVMGDGDFVMIHGRYIGWTEKTMVGVDIFRVKDGRLVEHWDVIQEEVPAEQTATGNVMFPIT